MCAIWVRRSHSHKLWPRSVGNEKDCQLARRRLPSFTHLTYCQLHIVHCKLKVLQTIYWRGLLAQMGPCPNPTMKPARSIGHNVRNRSRLNWSRTGFCLTAPLGMTTWSNDSVIQLVKIDTGQILRTKINWSKESNQVSWSNT